MSQQNTWAESTGSKSQPTSKIGRDLRASGCVRLFPPFYLLTHHPNVSLKDLFFYSEVMMQETVLRVFVVALGLLLCPRDDPGVEEWDEIVSLQKYEEKLQREEEKLTAPVSDKKRPQHDTNNLLEQKQPDGRAFEKDKPSDSDVIFTAKHQERDDADQKIPQTFIDKSGTSLQEKSIGETKTEQKQKDILINISVKEAGSLQEGKKLENKDSSSEEQESHPSHVHAKTTEKETAPKFAAEWERDYLWYFWNTLSIISMIRFFRKYLRRHLQMNEEVTGTVPGVCRAAAVLLPDADTLRYFYKKYVQVSSEKKWRKDEFLEGFASDLLVAMRTVCANSDSMLIEDFHVVNTCDIIVHFAPPEPYGCQSLLWSNKVSDLMLDMQVSGQIKLVEEKKIQSGCPCQSSPAAANDDDDDMVCLLHTEKVKTKMVDACDGPLCSKNTPFLSKSKVTRWFQSTIKQAWAQISHKYEFELNICYTEAPGALAIRFRSGKRIRFNLNPVIKFNSEAHFFITSWSSSHSDTFWTLSLTKYEDHLIEHLSKRLPENSCHNQTLEIAHFLHKRQTALSGSAALKDFHFKTALMHLLLRTKASQWNPNFVACRLRDLLDFMEKSLEKKLLTHVLIGNPLAEVIKLPTEFTKAKPVNLFHPLVVHNCLYENAVMHFQEMLRNTNMLIHDYVAQHANGANPSELLPRRCSI